MSERKKRLERRPGRPARQDFPSSRAERISRQESFEAWGPKERRVYERHVPEVSLNAQETLQVRETHAAHIARALLLVNFLYTGNSLMPGWVFKELARNK